MAMYMGDHGKVKIKVDALGVTSQTSYSPEYTTPTQKKNILLDYIGIEGTRFCSEISLTRTDLIA
jgi:hypothetical protein